MPRVPLPLLLPALSCAFATGAAAQDPRPARDSIRVAEVQAEPDSGEATAVEVEAETDTVPVPGPYARSGGSGPFSVQASGQVAPRPERGEIVWVNAAPRAPADTARASGAARVATAPTARRDTAAPSRPAARDTAAPSRPAARDTARTGTRVTTGQPARRDTVSRTRPPTPRDTARGGQRVSGNPARRDTSAAPRPPAAGEAGRTGSAARARSHTVVAGETFYAIARRYGVTAAQLRALNPGVDVDALDVGVQLRLPAGARDSRAGAPPRPRAPAATSGQGAQPSRPGARSHTVQAGETLFGIARRYGVTVDAIRRANGMETDQVRAGERIVIPPAR